MGQGIKEVGALTKFQKNGLIGTGKKFNYNGWSFMHFGISAD